jgi:hypothetical protein
LKNNKWIRIALILITLGIIIWIVLTFFIEPFAAKKTESTLNEKNPNYLVKVEKVNIRVIPSEIEFRNISIASESDTGKKLYLKGSVASVRIRGIKIIKAIFKKSISIRSISIAGTSITGIIPSDKEVRPPFILPLNITADRLFLDNTDLHIKNKANSLSYSLKNGTIKVYNIHLLKHDTLSADQFQQFDFMASEIGTVAPDSIYSYNVRNIDYSSGSNTLSADSFFIHPNYTDYAFSSRFEYRKPRIETILSNIHIEDINIADYIRSGNIYSSFIEAGNMEMYVFNDKRKEFRHIDKLPFQDMIYSFPGLLRLDTIAILNGNITYKERAEKANEAGHLTFNNLNAMIYNITNDSVYRIEKAFLELRCKALLMKKGKIEILLKSRIFDRQNTFSVKGTLYEMEMSEMNPFLEKSVFVYVTSGKLDKMDFSFTSDNSESKGTMTMIYNGLDLAVKNKNTDDTTAFKERLISLVVNIKVKDSNPIPGKEVREGTIYTKRDSERFLFHYCAKSILSGIKSSLLKN